MIYKLGHVFEHIDGHSKTQFKNGEVIVSAGQHQSPSHLITRGFVKVYDINSDGTVKTIAILKKGDVFPLIWGFDHPQETVYYYKAMGTASTTKVPTQELKKSLQSDSEMAHAALMQFVYLSWDLMERVKCLQMPYTYEKLLRLMPYLAAKMGKKRAPDMYILQQKITQEEIARMLGATRESISAHLSELEKNHVIDRSGRTFSIDISMIPSEYIHKIWFKEAVVK